MQEVNITTTQMDVISNLDTNITNMNETLSGVLFTSERILVWIQVFVNIFVILIAFYIARWFVKTYVIGWVKWLYNRMRLS